jgi:phage regulator Rha-like protein
MEIQPIQNKIYEIRGVKVMLDFDLAQLYHVETRRLKEQVKRNIERFPEDFMFQLSKQEWNEVIANCDNLPENMKYAPATPFAFTEQGTSMLSAVLRSETAVQASIAIMRAFVAMRQLLMSSTEIRQLALENAEIRTKIELLERENELTLGSVNDLSEKTREEFNNIHIVLGVLSDKVLKPPPPPERPRNKIGYYTPAMERQEREEELAREREEKLAREREQDESK